VSADLLDEIGHAKSKVDGEGQQAGSDQTYEQLFAPIGPCTSGKTPTL
jgi:hypothetical protein